MAAFIASGHIAILILVLTMFEAAALILFRRVNGGGIAVKNFLPSLLAGDFLLLAWLGSAAGADWRWSAAALLGALLSHLADMFSRWQSKEGLLFVNKK